MRKERWSLLILIFVIGGALCSAQQSSSSADTDAARLPVKRVVLYKNGVGYFEHSARVRGNQELGIDFTTGQLNDVLKSLTVVDLGDGKISDIRYNSIAPLDERLRALRLPFGEQITRAEFLSALRGSRVEVAGKGESATGRLLSVEQEDRTNDSGATYHVTDFSIVTDSGEMKNFELGPAVSVRLADHELNDEVGRYLNLVGSSRARDLRRMTVSASGSGDRDIFVSYISEVPVWKSTYRIILPEKPNEKPLLQGWAIVDNTIGEDWKDVQLSLIAGAPQSFIQNISQPLYARRPEIALPESAMLTPQTHEGTMQEEQASVSNGPLRPSGVVGGVPGGVPGGQMHGIVNGALVMPNTGLTVNEQVGMAAKTDRLEQYAKLNPAAEAQELGEYFEYNIKQSITIGKNQSALVPILQSRIDAEKVTLWTANGSQPPLRALWVKNASGLTLDAGTFNIIDNGTFAGEGLIETVHANERRLLSYAADTGIRITSQFESRDLPVSRVQILKGVMFLTKEHRDNVRYIIRNADTSSRQVVIEHPVREGWKLVNTDKPQETSASHYRFQVAVDPDKTKELAVEEVHQDVSRSMLTEITQHQVEVLATENVMTPELQAAFRRVLDQKAQISKLQSETGTRQMELSAINTDQARIRENMKALRGSVEEKALLLRYTHQLNSQEDRLSLLHKEIKDLEQKQNAEHQKLDDMVQHITL
jgi:hypothetical protein